MKLVWQKQSTISSKHILALNPPAVFVYHYNPSRNKHFNWQPIGNNVTHRMLQPVHTI